NLRDEGLSKSEVDIVIHHDRKSESDYGQQTAKLYLTLIILLRIIKDKGRTLRLRLSVLLA
ncbi:hypothetical protein CKJ90_31650, partial [Klebsiella pneumoniae]